VGVNHFDLARSYGYGEAEALVGRELRSVRDEVVLVTKFGIRASAAAVWLRPLKPLFRALRGRKHPGGCEPEPSGALPAKPAGWSGRLFHERLPMTAATMRASLERSLRVLHTDRVEYFLMHEPAELSHFDELAAAAEELKRTGKIRAWGLACLQAALPAPEIPAGLDLWQTDAPPSPVQFAELRHQAGGKGLVLFSPLRGILATDRRDRLLRLWQEFPAAVVLCSMFTPAHIRQNAALIP
jgi:aryl-alcohol dehydrogenase-like predicted oxidoreductase